MAADFDTFKLKYPELVADNDANQQAIEDCIDEASLIFGTPPCANIADSLLLAWSAHCIALSGNNPNGQDEGFGTRTSESVGSVSVSYQVADSTGMLSDYYKATPYGQKFLILQKYCFGSGVMVAP